MGFKIIQFFARNPWLLAYGFTKNRQFAAKTDQSPYFLMVTPIFWIDYT
jgi:hypothetical protein